MVLIGIVIFIQLWSVLVGIRSKLTFNWNGKNLPGFARFRGLAIFKHSIKMVHCSKKLHWLPAFRPMLPTSFLARSGTTTASGYPQTWPESTSFCPLSGSTKSGDLIRTSRMPKKLHSRPWPYQTIMSGFTGLRRFSIWSSKKHHWFKIKHTIFFHVIFEKSNFMSFFYAQNLVAYTG